MKPDSALPPSSARLPACVWWLMGVYTVASLAHFAHNAEYISFYPNKPAWITRETVYQAWLAIAGVGSVGAVFALFGWPVAGAVLVAAYGALGLDGLAHYSLALCSEHSLVANLTIWAEAGAGVALCFLASQVVFKQLASKHQARSAA